MVALTDVAVPVTTPSEPYNRHCEIKINNKFKTLNRGARQGGHYPIPSFDKLFEGYRPGDIGADS